MRTAGMPICLVVVLLLAGAVCASAADSTGLASAGPQTGSVVVAQAKAGSGAVSQPKAADPEVLSERVDSLEKDSVVLREDMGKARLDVKMEMDAAAKRYAEEIARVNKELAAVQAELEEERAAQARRNRKFWMAIGVVAIAALASN